MYNFKKNIYHLFRKTSMDYFWQIRNKAIKTRFKPIKAYYIHKYHRIEKSYGCFIPLSAKISPTTIFPHGLYGIFISSGAIIEEGCVIFQHVTIGSNMLLDSKSKGSPKIESNCYIGAGAKIIGNVKLGKNVRIGANCCVAKDIADNCTVVMIEPRIIVHDKIKNNNFVPYCT